MFDKKLDYEMSVLDCRQIQISHTLQQWKLPAELLYYNVCVSTDVMFEHLFEKQLKTWMFDAACYKVSELALLDVRYEELPFTSYQDIAPALKLTAGGHSSAFLWVVCGQVPYVKPTDFADLTALHSLWVQDWHAGMHAEYPSGYYIKDLYPVYDGLITEEEMRHLCDYPIELPEAKELLLLHRPTGTVSEQQKNIIAERHASWMSEYRDEWVMYHTILDYVDGRRTSPFESLAELYDCCAHAFKFISGSRYLYSLYLEHTKQDTSTISMLRELAQKARTLKQTFALASRNERLNIVMVKRVCMEMMELERSWCRWPQQA